MKWMTYVRGIVPLYRVYPTLAGAKGLINVVFYNDGKQMVFAWDAEQLKERSKEITLELAKQLEGEIKGGIKTSEQFLSKNITGKNALSLYHELYGKIAVHLGRANMYIDAYDEFPIQYGEPRYTSYVARLSNRLHRLKEKFSERELEIVTQEFWWTRMGWECLNELTREDFLNMLKEDQPLIKEVKTGDDLPSIFAELHDLRKEFQMKSAFAFLKILKSIAAEKKISISDAEWLMPGELENPDMKLISERRKKMYFLMADKIELFYGRKADMLSTDLMKYEKTDSITGKCAYPGLVRGKARVCKGVQKATNIKDAEILITGMTMPDYVPYMKRAAAVVTNEGGVTCHAGIICREFRIPCVVGTVHATEIFNTGDLIEVDASNGVVRRLK